jgi:Tol biopolymer transport system component
MGGFSVRRPICLFRSAAASGAHFILPSRVAALAVAGLALVACGGSSTPPTYTVGGSVLGLTGGASVVLLNNGGDSLTVPANGPFTFTAALANGASFAVTVGTQPTGETCTVSGGSGTIVSANVTTVSVSCAAAATYTIGGTVSGLAAEASVVLLDNGGDALPVDANGTFAFKTPLGTSATFLVTVGTQPTGETCTVSGGSGTVASANVTTVAVGCFVSTPTFIGIVSVNDSLVNSNEGGQNPSISATGRFIAFESEGTNLVTTPVQYYQVYLRDTCLGSVGCTPSTTLVSFDAAGTAGGNNAAQVLMASVSDDGNYVVFVSEATNIVSGATIAETYERTTCNAETASCTPSTQYGILDVLGEPPTYGGFGTVIDGTGRYVLSAANAADIVVSEFNPSGPYNSGIVDLYERDTCMTASGPVAGCTPGNVPIDFTPGPSFQQPDSSVDFEYGFSVSNGGRFVAFSSEADDLVAQDNHGFEQVYLHDTCSALNAPVTGCTFQTILISQDGTGSAGTEPSMGPSLSADGRFVAFTSNAALAPLATSGGANAFLRDTCLAYTSAPVADCTPTTYLISVNAAGTGDSGGFTSFSQSLSADGRFVAFEDSAPSITSAGNQGGGVYVRDTCNSSAGAIAACTPRTVAVSLDAAGTLIEASSYHALSADGHFLTFTSGAGTSLVPPVQVVLVATGF